MSPNRKFFESESTWPFLLRQTELDNSLSFLRSPTPVAPRLFRIWGPSGGGKSFFARELLVKYACSVENRVVVYVDIPPSDLEASEFFRKIDILISLYRMGDRAAPSSVPKELSKKWHTKKNLPATSRSHYLYGVLRDLLTLVPIIGPVIKAFLPPILPLLSNTATDTTAAIRFLMNQSYSQPVLIALDNIQFLSTSLLELLTNELINCGDHFRLVLIERTIGNKRHNWTPEIQNLIERNLKIEFGSVEDIHTLVAGVLPDEEDSKSLSEIIFRRSEGNLKSAWFQLKLISGRRASQNPEGTLESYQDVIQSLLPADQIVLRFVVFLLGGLSISVIIELFKAAQLGLRSEHVTTAIADLTALGLLIINGENNDKIRVEHEIVSSVVTALTPEEEKIELRAHLVNALRNVLGNPTINSHDDALYDRLIGIVHEQEVRSSAALQSHIVSFIYTQNNKERFSYLCGLYRDSVCWDIVDILPSDCMRIFLNSIQKCSLFSFGLVATQQLQKDQKYNKLASLYLAKYLVQLFRYEDAIKALASAEPSKEKDSIEFNILINLCENKKARIIAEKIFNSPGRLKCASEYELVVLRNAGHLFPPSISQDFLNMSVRGFAKLGNKFGVATTLNNLGVVELAAGKVSEARAHFELARKMLAEMDSREIYQPLVNLSATSLSAGNITLAKEQCRIAREFAPRSLVMDNAMFDFNDAILNLHANQMGDEFAIEIFQRIYRDAVKTKDIRFIEIVAWFTASLESAFERSPTVEYSCEMIEYIQRREDAGIEIFIDLAMNGKTIKAPYVLSPHWRY